MVHLAGQPPPQEVVALMVEAPWQLEVLALVQVVPPACMVQGPALWVLYWMLLPLLLHCHQLAVLQAAPAEEVQPAMTQQQVPQRVLPQLQAAGSWQADVAVAEMALVTHHLHQNRSR